jgi:hypothetical protein
LGGSLQGFGNLTNSTAAISFLSVPLQALSATGIKNHLMYSNSNKEYRKAMDKNRTSDRFWSFLNIGASVVLYGEGSLLKLSRNILGNTFYKEIMYIKFKHNA